MINLNLSSSDIKKYSKLLILVAAALLAAGSYFLWWPQYKEYKANSEELNNKEEEVRLKKEYNRELEGSLNLLLEYEEKISKIETALPEKFSIASIISFIQNKNSESGLSLSSINPSGEATSAVSESSARAAKEEKEEDKMVLSSGFEIKDVNFSITSAGSYSSFKNFLSAVWKSSRMANISSISFSSPAGEEGGGSIFDFNIDLTVSYYAPASGTEFSGTSTPPAE